MSEWFIPALEEFQSERALLHLGLNSSTRYYRELIVPWIGGVWFVRQLSWAVAGIELAKELSLKPAKVANAIEALACKLEWWGDPENYNKKGQRAFARDEEDEVWSFNGLSDKTNYVQVTYRQSSVRALSGLKLTTPARFNTMELTGTGRDLSEAFLNQSKIRGALISWLNGGDIHATGTIIEGLISCPNDEEKGIVKTVLRADSMDTLGDSHRRCCLIEAFGRNTENMPALNIIKSSLLRSQGSNMQGQVDNIDAALAFDEMLECGRKTIYTCAQLIADKAEPLTSGLVQNKNLSEALDTLRKAADKFQQTKGERHPDALAFAAEVLPPSAGNAERLTKLILRDGNILDISGQKVIEGHLFNRRRETSENNAASPEGVGTEESSTENKIRQLFELWGDCQ